jgi:hypothetical protein
LIHRPRMPARLNQMRRASLRAETGRSFIEAPRVLSEIAHMAYVRKFHVRGMLETWANGCTLARIISSH